MVALYSYRIPFTLDIQAISGIDDTVTSATEDARTLGSDDMESHNLSTSKTIADELPLSRENLSLTDLNAIAMTTFSPVTAQVNSSSPDKAHGSSSEEKEADYTNYACVKVNTKDKKAQENPKVQKALKCLFLAFTKETHKLRQDVFLHCMVFEGIALDDPAISENFKFASKRECFPNVKIYPNATVDDLRKTIDQRLICLTYINSLSIHIRGFLCPISQADNLDPNDREALFDYYRYSFPFGSYIYTVQVGSNII